MRSFLVLGRAAEAAPVLQEALAWREANIPADRWDRWKVETARAVLGESLLLSGRPQEAEPLLLASLEPLVAADLYWGLWCLDRLVEMREAAGRSAEADAYRERALELLDGAAPGGALTPEEVRGLGSELKAALSAAPGGAASE